MCHNKGIIIIGQKVEKNKTRWVCPRVGPDTSKLTEPEKNHSIKELFRAILYIRSNLS